MLKLIFYTLLVIAAWHAGKALLNFLIAKISVFSKYGAMRLAISPRYAISRGASILWKIIKNGVIVILIMTVIGIIIR